MLLFSWFQSWFSMKGVAIVLLILFASSAYAINGKCRALAMSGGGDKGSYEAAVYIELVNLLSSEDISYDVKMYNS